MQEATSQSNISVGAKLRYAREHRGISLDMLAKRMKISKKYLKMLEDGKLTDIPFASVYKRNFIRNYAKLLDLEPQSFLQQYDEDVEDVHVSREIPETHRKRPVFIINVPLLTRLFLGVGVLLAIAIYIGLQIQNILRPPELFLITPEDGMITEEPSLSIKGQTESEVRVLLNGKDITVNEGGNFEEKIDLQRGLNKITITAETKHERVKTEIRHVTYRPPFDWEPEETEDDVIVTSTDEILEEN